MFRPLLGRGGFCAVMCCWNEREEACSDTAFPSLSVGVALEIGKGCCGYRGQISTFFHIAEGNAKCSNAAGDA